MALFAPGRKARLIKKMAVPKPVFFEGYQFTLKGSPRHYDDVKKIIEAEGDGNVYFGEALAYERGAGIALWRIRTKSFGWLTNLYEWWVEMERIEPIQFTFHLYLPDDLKYPVLDLRAHSANDVRTFIEQNAPWYGRRDTHPLIQTKSGQPNFESH
ncbi:MAG: hypothetical protein WKF81_09800 [Thermomicrobiales bacterium]